MDTNMEEYECQVAEKKLFEMLREAEEIIKKENVWMSLAELKASVGV